MLRVCAAWMAAVAATFLCLPARAERTPWTTSRIHGTPEPPLPYKTVRAFPRLKFKQPTLVAFAPGIDRMFVGEQGGKLFSFPLESDPASADLVIDLPKVITFPEKTGFDALYGVAFDPDFERNRFVYVCYVLRPMGKEILPEGSRVVRFTMTETNPPKLDPASEKLLVAWRAGGHNGGCLEFGPDRMLYISTGDGSGPNPPDPLRTGQDCSDLLSSILRIDPRREERGRSYGIPKDNPFASRPASDNIRPEIWAYGLRNPWKMTFDRKTGELWVADVGWDQWEMVHLVRPGGNYGWGAYEGRQPLIPDVKPGPTPYLPPLLELPHTISASVTGGYVYRGRKFPDLTGEYIFSDWETKTVWAGSRDEVGAGKMRDLADSGLQVVAFGEDHAGELYLADYGQGVLHTLERNDQAIVDAPFPRKLSETGLFRETKEQTPAAGVVPFEINMPQWSDFATAQRWIALPGKEQIVWHPRDRSVPGSMFSRQLDFPAESVLAKTLSLEMKTGDAGSAKKMETQVLHFDGRVWRGYSYAWNDEQTDADLVPAQGQERRLLVDDDRLAGGKRVQNWVFSSRAQCLSCHGPWPQYTLAFSPRQLRRQVVRDGEPVDQLVSLEKQGIVGRVDGGQKPLGPLDPATLESIPKLAAPDDPGATSAELARSYLHVNCSHCHRDNGGGAGSFELLHNLADDRLRAIGEAPRQGTFDLAGAQVIAPGNPARSLLYLRMAKFGRGHMPHLGAEFVDERALGWVADWISGLQSPSGRPLPNADVPSAGVTVAALEEALQAARKIGRNEIIGEERESLLKEAHGSASFLVRDLFSGYQPRERQREQLGMVIRPETILSRTGDPDRGRELFWKSPTLQCRQCHAVGEQGGKTGPNLRDIAARRTPAELLESLLEPSKKIEPQFATYLLETRSGRILSGLLVRQTEAAAVLRDAQGTETEVAAADIERLEKSPVSLMPAGLLRRMTAEEASDLLQFLKSPGPLP